MMTNHEIMKSPVDWFSLVWAWPVYFFEGRRLASVFPVGNSLEDSPLVLTHRLCNLNVSTARAIRRPES